MVTAASTAQRALIFGHFLSDELLGGVVRELVTKHEPHGDGELGESRHVIPREPMEELTLPRLGMRREILYLDLELELVLFGVPLEVLDVAYLGAGSRAKM